MNHREFESFKTPELDNITEITPVLFLDPSKEVGKAIVYVIHTEKDLIALGVDIEEATDPFYIDDCLKDHFPYCDLCETEEENRESLEQTALDSNKYSVDSFKGDGLRVNEDEVEFADIHKYNVCENCYKALIDRLSEWMKDNSTEISSHII